MCSLIVPGGALLLSTVESFERWGIPGGPSLKLYNEVLHLTGVAGTTGTFFTVQTNCVATE